MSSTDATGGYGTWAQITQRALADPDFRESLLLDPRATIEDATGPDGWPLPVLTGGLWTHLPWESDSHSGS